MRWQLDGWLTGHRRRGGRAPAARPTAGIVRLRLVPDGVVAHAGLQPGLWGEAGGADERAHRALIRVQGLLGPDAVVTAVLGGGRVPGRPGAPGALGRRPDTRAGPAPPWPGRLPPPAPGDRAARAAARGGLRRRPATGHGHRPAGGQRAAGRAGRRRWAASRAERGEAIRGWAGPWPVDERWWAPGEARRQARFQVCLADGRALLLALRAGAWVVEAIYD